MEKYDYGGVLKDGLIIGISKRVAGECRPRIKGYGFTREDAKRSRGRLQAGNHSDDGVTA